MNQRSIPSALGNFNEENEILIMSKPEINMHHFFLPMALTASFSYFEIFGAKAGANLWREESY